MKILSIIEATTVTGPAKNLLNFCRLMRSPEFCRDGVPQIEVSIVTFDRVSEPGAVATGSYTQVTEPRATGSNDSSCHLDPVATARGSDTNAFVTAAREAGITVDVIKERFRFDRAVIKQLRDIVARRAPDVIQTHMIKSHFLVKLSGLGKQYPWIAYHHGYTSTDLKMRFYNHLNRWSLPSADRVITVCGAFAKQLSEAGVRPERIAIRHNGVVLPKSLATGEKCALRTQFGIVEDDRVILAIGRLSREKGHADLFNSIASVRDSKPEFKLKLMLVGDGPERDDLQVLAKTLALDNVAVFAGHVADVTPFYAIADVFALPSHSEGSPNVLLEAMAAGLPVVATSVGGVPEIATDEKDALLVPARNPAAFAEALRRALSDAALVQKLKTKAIVRAREFSPESHARSLIEIYEQLITATGAQESRWHVRSLQPGKRGRLRSSQTDA